MQPAIEITQRGEKDFVSCVGVGDGSRCYESEGLCSIAECLQDAAAVLGAEFSFATVIFDRMTMGSYPVATIEHRALEVADELLTKTFGRRTMD
ncbi:hypothetical protein SRS16CHR_03862 [Variovorax sp. SRS16]|uniref:hypothetical protein n=1 Tax=Variovorax sp. SRS16 TaxID=282217 RepID=UPI0013164BEA|nr:hypothetical protein [Variovorax sp. SRS16]VTU26458.1 hypothetical protein SRS16CHR_03862 [Variovorax sp. SRS16]